MNLAKGPARLGFAAALLALLLAPMAFGASSTLAQVSLPANYYGYVDAGQTVAASAGDQECGSSVADADGFWHIVVDGAPCGVEGTEISFTVDGDAAEQTVTWSSGDAPDDITAGITLTVAAMDDGMEDPDDGMEDPDDGMEDPDDGMEDPDDGMDSMTPGDKGDTGNAGLVTQSGTSALAVLALGVLALAGVAGARTVTGRID